MKEWDTYEMLVEDPHNSYTVGEGSLGCQMLCATPENINKGCMYWSWWEGGWRSDQCQLYYNYTYENEIN